MSDLLIITTVGLLASSPFFYLAGYLVGKRRGRDEQWVECFLAGEKREKARREKDGRFKTKTK